MSRITISRNGCNEGQGAGCCSSGGYLFGDILASVTGYFLGGEGGEGRGAKTDDD